MRRKHLVVLALGSLAACADTPDVTGPPASLQRAVVDTLPDDPSRPDEILSTRMARRVPGFGGISSDSTGALVIHLMHPGNGVDVAAARAAAAERFTEHSRYWSAQGKRPEIVFRQGRFTFAQLRKIRDRLNDDILRTEGVLFTDIDELANRFVVGIDAAHALPAQAAVRRLADSRGGGVEDEAIAFEVRTMAIGDCLERTCQPREPILPPPPDYATEPVIPADIRQRMETLVGGVQLQNQRTGGPATLGFILWHCGQSTVTERFAGSCRDWYVVTMHQTSRRAVVDDDPFYHPDTFYGSPQVAVEAIDTHWHTTPFPIKVDGNPSLGSTCQEYVGYRSLVCRRSDMALLRPVGDQKLRRGYLIRPAKRYADKYVQSDQFRVDQYTPFMRISGEGVANVGYTVDKIGVKTGWRYGQVTRICVDIARYASESNLNMYVLRCQTEMNIYGESGDSGAPVFTWNGMDGTARLLGLYHGGSSVSPGDYRYYSPLANIRNDLGLLNTDNANFKFTP